MVVPSFEELETDKVYVHCQVNVCTVVGNNAPCTQTCNPDNKGRTVAGKFQAKELTSTAITINKNLLPGVVVGKDGKPVVQEN